MTGSTGERPYIGLRYFEEPEAYLFYGRDEHVAELLGKLSVNRFVAVMGSSGSGKSSLVRAGLLPELRAGMIPEAGPRWKVVEFRPGRAPLVELAEAMRVSLGVENARDLVEEGPLGIVRAVQAAKLEERTNVLIIADQFEEIFRFEREESAQGRITEAAEQCAELVRRLLDAAAQTDVPVYVLLVMRSDYLGECAQFPDLPERMSQSLYLIPRLQRDQLQEAITAPVGGAIEPAVVQRLLGEVGSDPDQLPRLQHLLGRMWDRASGDPLTMQHYTACGGWEKGLEQHLEEEYARLNESQQKICGQVFARLSELDKGRAVRRRAEMDELIAVCGEDAAEVVKVFRRFLSPRVSPVDIAHECILREWPRSKEWLEREQRDANRLQELAGAARDAGWRSGMTEPEQNSVRGLEGLTLQNLVEWRAEAQPTRAWAQRYMKPEEFDSADRYLTWSDAADRQRKKEAASAKSRLRRWAWGTATVFLVFVGIAGSALYSQNRRLRASVLQVSAEEATQEALLKSARVRGLAAYAAGAQLDDPALALFLGWKSAQLERPLAPGLEAVLATALTNGPSYGILQGSGYSVTWSPDGKTLASAGDDGSVRLWDVASGQALRTLQGHQGLVSSVAWSPDGKTLASTGRDKSIRLWAAASGQPLRTLQGHQDSVSSVAWSPDGKTLASASLDETVRLWDSASGKPLRTLEGHQDEVSSVAWSPDGKTLASASLDKTIRLWDAANGQPLRTLEGHGQGVEGVAWSPDGKTLASASSDKTIRLWEAASGQPLRTLPGHQDVVISVAWSPDGKTLASASNDKTIRLWEASSGQPLRTLQGHQNWVYSVAWSPDGKTLASAGEDGSIRLWEVGSGQPLRTLQGHQDVVISVAWSPDGKTLASASSDNTIRLWEAASGQLLRTLKGHQDEVSSVAWSPDGKTLASAGADKTVRLWEAVSAKPLRTLEGHQEAVYSVAWSPDGKTLASAGADKTIRLWVASSGQPLRTLQGHQNWVYSVAWSPDGKTLASASLDKTVRLWDAASGQPLRALQGGLASVAWSPDGKTLASGSGDIQLWEAASGQPLRTMQSHQAVAFSVAWSPDGKTLASAGFDHTVRLWEASSGQPLRTLQGHEGTVTSVAWSPDGKTLASASWDNTVRLWPGTVDALLDQVRNSIRLFTLSKEDCQRYVGVDDCPALR